MMQTRVVYDVQLHIKFISHQGGRVGLGSGKGTRGPRFNSNGLLMHIFAIIAFIPWLEHNLSVGKKHDWNS